MTFDRKNTAYVRFFDSNDFSTIAQCYCQHNMSNNYYRYSINGERLGTYDGHGGAVWCIDVDWQTKNFLSGAADNTIRLWDVENGIMLNRIDTKSAVRTCKFSFSGNMVAFTTDKNMGQPCVIHIVDTRIFGSGKD